MMDDKQIKIDDIDRHLDKLTAEISDRLTERYRLEADEDAKKVDTELDDRLKRSISDVIETLGYDPEMQVTEGHRIHHPKE